MPKNLPLSLHKVEEKLDPQQTIDITKEEKDTRRHNYLEGMTFSTPLNKKHAIHHKSSMTPFPQLKVLAEKASKSMTSKLKKRITSLQTEYSSTTAF